MANFLTSGLAGLGSLFAEKATGALQGFQNSIMPSTKPTNTNTFSFDFGKAFNKAVSFASSGFTGVGAALAKEAAPAPAPSTGSEYLKDFLGFGYNAAKTIGAGYVSSIADKIRNSNNRPDITIQTGTSAGNPVPSQNSGVTLSDLLTLLNAGNNVAGTTSSDIVAAQAAKTSQYSVFLIGGAALLLVFLMSSKGAK